MSMLVVSFVFANRYITILGLPHTLGISALANYFLLSYSISAPYGEPYRRRLLLLTTAVFLFFSALSWVALNTLPSTTATLPLLWEHRLPIEMVATYGVILLASGLPFVQKLKYHIKSPPWCSLVQTLCLGLLGHIVMAFVASYYHHDMLPLLQGNLLTFLLGTCIGALILSGIDTWYPLWHAPQAAIAEKTSRTHMAYQALVLSFCGACLFSNFLVVKQVSVGSWCVTLAFFSYGITFLLTDVLSELFGEQRTTQVMWAGFGSSIAMLAITLPLTLCTRHPASPTDDVAFAKSSGFVTIGMLASLVAFLAAQWTDIALFSALRKKTKGRYLWLRNNTATIISQALDTFLFATLAWGLSSFAPETLPEDWWGLSCREYLGKVIFALCDTPFVYALLYLLRTFIKQKKAQKTP